MALIVIWEAVFRAGFWPEYLFPSPLGVLNNLTAGFKDGTFIIAIAASMQRIAVGYSVSLVAGLLLGLVIVSSRFLDDTLSPVLLGLQTLPSICWLPLAILWFGIGEDSIIFVIIIGSIFSITMATLSGVKNVPPIYVRVAKTMGARGIQAYTSVVIPAALPTIIGGMKQGWSFAWRALMAAELLSPKNGLGYVLTIGRDLHDMDQVFGVMLVIIIIGLTIDKCVFGRIENLIRTRWGLNRA